MKSYFVTDIAEKITKATSTHSGNITIYNKDKEYMTTSNIFKNNILLGHFTQKCRSRNRKVGVNTVFDES